MCVRACVRACVSYNLHRYVSFVKPQWRVITGPQGASCKPTEDFDGVGLCYPRCNAGFYAVGPVLLEDTRAHLHARTQARHVTCTRIHGNSRTQMIKGARTQMHLYKRTHAQTQAPRPAPLRPAPPRPAPPD